MSDRDPEQTVYELDELVNQPGTYFNPKTEVLLIVDDSQSMDQEVFDQPAFRGADWVQISEETPVDEVCVEEEVESFQTRHMGSGAGLDTALEPDEADLDTDPEPELEPDEED